MQRILINKCSLLMAGSVCHVKRITNGSRKFLNDVRKSQMTPDQVACSDCNRSNCAAGGRVDLS
jgi:hypothetical protein